MISDALKTLKGMIEASRVDVLERRKNHVLLYDRHSGLVSRTELDSFSWLSTVIDFDSLAAAIKRFWADKPLGIWIDTNRVVVVFGDNVDRAVFRWNQVHLPLAESSVYLELTKLVGLSPANLAEAIKFNLFAAKPNPSDFGDRLSVLNFESGSTSEHVNRSADASIRKSTHERATGVDKLPEEVVFSFLPFPVLADELNRKLVDVRCAVRVNPGREQVSILPYPEQIAAARRAAALQVRDAIVTRLPELAESVFFGSAEFEE